MTRADNIIKEFLDKAGIENTFNEKEALKFKVDKCEIKISKQNYKGYHMSTKCIPDKDHVVESSAININQFSVVLEPDTFRVNGTNYDDEELYYAHIDIVTKSNKSNETGKWYILCRAGPDKCELKKYY